MSTVNPTAHPIRPQELVERALAVPGAVDTVGRVVSVCGVQRGDVALGEQHDDHERAQQVAELVGDRADRVGAGAGVAAGVVSSSAEVMTGPGDVEQLVRAAEAAARQAGPARRDVAELPAGTGTDVSWGDPAAETSIKVYDGLAGQLGEAFGLARDGKRTLYGFASHEVATTWLGTSAGVRRRWIQPTSSVELNAKTTDLSRSAWAGRSIATASGFTSLDLLALEAELATRLAGLGRPAAGRATRRPLSDDPAAVCGCRPARLPVLADVPGGPRRRAVVRSPRRARSAWDGLPGWVSG